MAPKKGISKEFCWCKGCNGSILRDPEVIAKHLEGGSFSPDAPCDFFEKYTKLLRRKQSFEGLFQITIANAQIHHVFNLLL